MATGGGPPRDYATRGPGAIEILDEALALLRRTPLSIFFIYYAGTLPFALGLIFFVFEMTEGADAGQELVPDALLLTLLFLWLKTCQAVFSRQVLARLEGDQESWTLRRWANTAIVQSIFAGSFVVVYPLAIFITLPFGWVNAFYHNVSIVGTGPQSSLRSTWIEAAELSRLWPKQNHLILAVLLASFLFLFLNLAVFIAMIPNLLNMLFGISTIFDENVTAWNNSSFYLDIFVFCFLLLNPLNKVVHVLRCFYGRARFNGADILSELRHQRRSRVEWARAAVLILATLLMVSGSPMRGADATPAPASPTDSAASAQLDRAIGRTLAKGEFSWRVPRPAPKEESNGLMDKINKFVLDWLNKTSDTVEKFLRWIFGPGKTSNPVVVKGTPAPDFPWRLFFIVALILVVSCVVWMLVRNFRHHTAFAPLDQTSPMKSVDLESENVRADDLPEDSWLALAQELWDKGETRLALRAFYLATLALLAQKEMIRLGPAKSNRDYLRELGRRLRGQRGPIDSFRENLRLFEESWYGDHPVTPGCLESMRANHQTVRSYAPA